MIYPRLLDSVPCRPERPMSLEEYLADQYNRDLQDIKTVEQVLADVAELFAASFDLKNRCWPYQLRADDKTTVGRQSQGTSAMILAAIGKMIEVCTLRDASTVESLPNLPKSFLDIFTS